MWTYDPPGTQHSSLVTAGYAVAVATLYSMPATLLYLLMGGSTAVTIISRASQLLANVRQKGVGQLAFLTLFLNFAGSAVRIFTTVMEIEDRHIMLPVLVSFILATGLNGALLAQYLYYVVIAPRSKGGGGAAADGEAAATKPAPAPAATPAPASAPAPAAAAAEPAVQAPVSTGTGRGSGSGGGARRRASGRTPA